MCDWFALCDDEPVGTTPHPVLGPVPICRSCADRFHLPITEGASDADDPTE